MPTAFAIDQSQLPEALRAQLKLWVEKTAASFGEEGSMLFFVRKKPTERRNLMRSIQTLAKASWELELPAGNWLRDVDILGKAAPTGNEPDNELGNGPTGNAPTDDDEPESPTPLVERKSCPNLHKPLQTAFPAPTAPTVEKSHTPQIYRSLLPADYGEQVRRKMMVKAAA